MELDAQDVHSRESFPSGARGTSGGTRAESRRLWVKTYVKRKAAAANKLEYPQVAWINSSVLILTQRSALVHAPFALSGASVVYRSRTHLR